MTTGPNSREAAQAAIPATVFDDEAAAGARSYAEALIKVAEGDGRVDAVLVELEEILADVFASHPQFAAILTGGGMGQEARDGLIVRLFEGRAMPTVVKFLRILNRHGRLGLLGTIVQQARTTWDRRQNRRPVTIRTAVPIDDGQLESLRGRLAALVGGEPVIRTEVDPSLIGGLVVQVGDEVFDASIRSRLQKMRRQIVEGKLHEVRRRFAEPTTA